MISKIIPISIISLIILICQSCSGGKNTGENNSFETAKKGSLEILVEAEAFFDSNSEFQMETANSGNQIMSTQVGGWLAFDVNIPVAGRYTSQVHLSSVSSQSCWIEDYFDNKDNRTYNITGTMLCNRSSGDTDFFTLSKDGSPLNAGLHKMKLHVDSGEVKIDWLKFILLKEHQETPMVYTQNMKGSEWVVVWADEFNDTGLPDTSKWTYDIGNWGWGNFELQYYTEARAENTRIENGNLIIEARKNDMENPWTSTRITTRGKESFLYGKIAFRAKVPAEKGNWAAGWTLGDSYIDELSWPYCGELDILESVGYEINDTTGNGKNHASVHCGAYYFKKGNQRTGILDVDDMKDQFHTYSLEWFPDSIKAYVDDHQYFSYYDTSTDLSWPYNKPQNIILNLAMGGGWGGALGMNENITSQELIIDYVRVYELK